MVVIYFLQVNLNQFTHTIRYRVFIYFSSFILAIIVV